MNSSRIEKCGQGRPDRDSPIYDPDGQKADQSTVTNHQPSHQLYNFLSIFSFSLSLSLFLSFFPSQTCSPFFSFSFLSFSVCPFSEYRTIFIQQTDCSVQLFQILPELFFYIIILYFLFTILLETAIYL